MKPTTNEIRYYHVSEKNDQSSTHSDTCWTWHRSCAIAMLCDEVDRLRELVECQEKLLCTYRLGRRTCDPKLLDRIRKLKKEALNDE